MSHNSIGSLIAIVAWLALSPHGQAEDAPTGGTIEGVVTYTYDSKRPWRYGRYYVKGRKSGPLAEAVVAIDASALRRTPPPMKPSVVEMDQKDFRFVPETLVIRAGDKVKFTNADGTIHNVSSSFGLHPFDVSIGKGQESIETFPKAGGALKPVAIGCKFHSNMHAWIYVFDHSFHALTKPDGKFRFTNVPPGRYRIDTVHPSGGLRRTRTISVSAGKTTKLEVGLSPKDKTLQK